jgi:signal transduction histidine kinase
MQKFLTVVAAIFFAGAGFADENRGSADDAMNMIIGVAELYEKVGREATLEAITEEGGPFRDRDLYVLVWNTDGVMIGHGLSSPLIGTERWDFQDDQGTYVTRDVIATAAAGGGWVPYRITDPNTGEIKDKTTFALQLDEETVAGVGIYAN